VLRGLRIALSQFAARRAERAGPASAGAARWWRLACSATPHFTPAFAALVTVLRAREDRWGVLAVGQEAADRFPDNPDAWMLLGEARQLAYRPKDALVAYEQALALEERADAAIAAGQIYRRTGRPAEAAARFARAYAAGGGPEALRQNAEALFLAGDEAAAEEALHLWATLVPDGMNRLTEARAELRAAKRPA
jgi:tetratricopeptide (TPR) repeat protein